MATNLLESQPAVWKSSAAESSKLIQTICLVTALSLKSGSGPAHVSLYDAKDLSGATPNALRWTLDASAADVDNQSFSSALIFRKGLFAVMDQGADFNAELCFAALKYT